MTVLEMYEKIVSNKPLNQRLFFNYLNESINELTSLHGCMAGVVFYPNIIAADLVPVKSFDTELNVLPLYHSAIIDNIMFLCGNGDVHKAEFVRKAQEAYLHYWNISSKGKRMKRAGW